MNTVKLSNEQEKSLSDLFKIIQLIPWELRKEFYDTLEKVKKEIPNDYELGNRIRNLL